MTTRTHIAVAALVRDGLVLLGHRHPLRRWYPDCWDLVGGHVEPGEAPRAAIVRECREELGVHVHRPQPIPLACSDPTLAMHAFLVTDWDGEPANTAHDEHDDLRWFRPSELARLSMADQAAVPSIVRAVAAASRSGAGSEGRPARGQSASGSGAPAGQST